MIRRHAIVGATLLAVTALLPATALALDRLDTSSAVTVSPTGGNGNTVFEVRAKVTPIPDGGYVRLSSWSAEVGGELIYSNHLSLNANGVAVLTNIKMPAGYNWWQVEYSGNSYFAPSTSRRTSIRITGLATSLSEVSFNADQYGVGISAMATVSYGRLQLYVDGEVLADCAHGRSTDLSSCGTDNNFPPGEHEVWLTLIPEDGRYLPTRTETFTFFNGPPLPPSSGILVEANAFSTSFRDVTINVAGFNQGAAVAQVRLSNTSMLAGNGLLADGTTVDYQPTLAWSLASGADGHRVVWAQLIHQDGSVSDTFNDSIYLDTTAPTGSFVINDGAASFGDAWTCSYEEPALTGSVSEASLTEGGRLTHIAISNDGKHYAIWPDSYGESFRIPWSVTAGGGSNDYPGTHTVYMKWRDAAGNWSDVSTDSIEFNACGYLGRVLIDGEETGPPDPSYRSSPTVEVRIEVWNIPPAGYRRVRLSHNIWDGPAKSFAWPEGATSLTLDWSLIDPDAAYPTKDGFRNISAELITNDGYSVHIGAMVILDRVVPTSDVPIPGFALNTTVSETTTAGATAGSTDGVEFAADVQWAGQDGAGVASYELDRLVDGTWRDVELGRADATWVRQTVENGSLNQFRVKAVDLAGNSSAWKNGAAFTATARQDSASSIVYKGAWRSESSSDAFGGTQRATGAAGATIKTTFTGRAIAWVARRAPGAGKASVYVDGKFIKTVYLNAAITQPRRIVFTMSWKAAGTHTIKIVKPTSSGTMRVDAFLILT